MRKGITLGLPILASLISLIAGLHTVGAQNATNMTAGANMTNATSAGNMTGGNATTSNTSTRYSKNASRRRNESVIRWRHKRRNYAFAICRSGSWIIKTPHPTLYFL